MSWGRGGVGKGRRGGGGGGKGMKDRGFGRKRKVNYGGTNSIKGIQVQHNNWDHFQINMNLQE